jgi:integrase
MATRCQNGRWSCSKKPISRCSLKSPNQPVRQSWTGSSKPNSRARISCFRAESGSPHITTRQYARIVEKWVVSIGLNPADYGTHSFRRTKASLIYRRTKNLRAVQLLLGHTKLESTVRYLGIEVDDALEMAEQTEV